MTRSVAIIGAGQIGFAATHAFCTEAWDVTILSRTRPAWLQFPQQWRAYDAGVDPPPRADAVLDTIAYDAADVSHYDPDCIGRLIVVSSASVYCDDQGRTLDEGPVNGYPEFAGAITEHQSTVKAGPESYSTRKVRMEECVRALFGERATILRPCAIYGQWSRHPREWWFVKRLLDGRAHIPLIFGGQSQFQTSDVGAIAATAEASASLGVGGIFNIADADAPSVREIGEAIAACLDKDVEFVGLEEVGLIGRTPWSVPRPFIVSSARAAVMTGKQSCSYADRMPLAVQWLHHHAPADWRVTFPQLAAYPWDLFDYAVEDRFFASL
ncbi:MAG: reductase [Alphaproteobacteria bacterium HGW-Alphaproteobacteria-15]|nr:MAG: reductase [Alphaproteobacteria bacterium HGW-Alphaproteobacteria-15]